MKWFLFFFTVVLMFFPILSSGADQKAGPTEIISISYTRDSAGVEHILFHLAARMEPELFRLRGENPRLVIDFVNSYYKGQNPITLPEGILATSIRSGIHQKPLPKTRIVVDLSKSLPVHYTHAFDEGTGILTVKLTRQPEKSDAVAAEKEPLNREKMQRQAEFEARPMDKKPIPPLFIPEKGKDRGTAGKQSEALENAKPVMAGSAKDQAETALVDVAANGKAGPKASVEQSAEKPADASTRPEILNLSFDDSSERGEMVLFHLNHFFSPTVSALEKGTPRVLCDFDNAFLGLDVATSIDVNGKYIQRIEGSQLKNPDRVRVVLQLVPDRDYDLQQVFFRNENLFVLIVNQLSPDGSGTPE